MESSIELKGVQVFPVFSYNQ